MILYAVVLQYRGNRAGETKYLTPPSNAAKGWEQSHLLEVMSDDNVIGGGIFQIDVEENSTTPFKDILISTLFDGTVKMVISNE